MVNFGHFKNYNFTSKSKGNVKGKTMGVGGGVRTLTKYKERKESILRN